MIEEAQLLHEAGDEVVVHGDPVPEPLPNGLGHFLYRQRHPPPQTDTNTKMQRTPKAPSAALSRDRKNI